MKNKHRNCKTLDKIMRANNSRMNMSNSSKMSNNFKCYKTQWKTNSTVSYNLHPSSNEINELIKIAY